MAGRGRGFGEALGEGSEVAWDFVVAKFRAVWLGCFILYNEVVCFDYYYNC